jgi:hypothetical protein
MRSGTRCARRDRLRGARECPEGPSRRARSADGTRQARYQESAPGVTRRPVRRSRSRPSRRASTCARAPWRRRRPPCRRCRKHVVGWPRRRALTRDLSLLVSRPPGWLAVWRRLASGFDQEPRERQSVAVGMKRLAPAPQERPRPARGHKAAPASRAGRPTHLSRSAPPRPRAPRGLRPVPGPPTSVSGRRGGSGRGARACLTRAVPNHSQRSRGSRTVGAIGQRCAARRGSSSSSHSDTASSSAGYVRRRAPRRRVRP